MDAFKVIIAGGRDFNNYDLLKEKVEYYIRDLQQTHEIIIVSGHAKGADALGERFAEEHNLQCELHPADWKTHGRAAGPLRNAEMADCSQALIAFWDGQSRGTKRMIKLAERKGLQVAVVDYRNH